MLRPTLYLKLIKEQGIDILKYCVNKVSMQTSIDEFNKKFGTDEACIRYVFKHRFPHHRGYYYYPERKAFVNKRGKYIFPLAGTIFHKSRTPLTKWFYALFLFYSSKNGVAATELERQLGVTYKCAWRMGHQIRSLMKQKKSLLSGTVEADETYIGGKTYQKYAFKNKVPVLGLLERGGRVKAKVSDRDVHLVLKYVTSNVKKGSTLMTDQFGVYAKTARMGYIHNGVNHWKKEFVRGDVHTNGLEGFWSQFKRSLNGTHHAVSKGHLQKYVDASVWAHNNRDVSFETLLEAI